MATVHFSYAEYVRKRFANNFWRLIENYMEVMIELSKENMIFDIVALINSAIITVVDLKDFSDELKEDENYFAQITEVSKWLR